MEGAARLLDDVGFLKLFLPLLMFAGVAIFGYLAFTGITRRHTYGFGRRRFVLIEGKSAVVTGVIYLVVAPSFLFLLGPLSFYMWFG